MKLNVWDLWSTVTYSKILDNFPLRFDLFSLAILPDELGILEASDLSDDIVKILVEPGKGKATFSVINICSFPGLVSVFAVYAGGGGAGAGGEGDNRPSSGES